jgi:hypothetical protein
VKGGTSFAVVELRLDGQPVATMSGGVWQTECDFGPELLPHELVAVALNEAGEEVARARQLVNVPRAEAETTILLHRNENGVPISARVAWQSAYHADAVGAKITFDGEVLSFSDLSRIELPAHDPAQVHFLTAEVELPDGMISRSQVIFGGVFGDEVRSSLTAVPVVTDKDKLTMADVTGCFQVDGKPIPVVAVEKGDASLFVVQDTESRTSLMTVEKADRTTRVRPWAQGVMRRGTRSEVRDPHHARKMLYGSLPEEGEEVNYDRFRFVHPFALSQRTKAGFVHLFPILPTLKLNRDSLRWFLYQAKGYEGCNPELRLTDAVAVAGVRAAAESSRRAVLLVVDGIPEEHSEYSAEAVRRYLESLQVPLYVWSTDRKVKKTPWGEAERITTYDGFLWLSQRIEVALGKQWVVWLDGSYLPNKITLTNKAKGIELVQ